jgi:hypothetical protein
MYDEEFVTRRFNMMRIMARSDSVLMIRRRVCGLACLLRRQYHGISLMSPDLDGEWTDILIEAVPARASRRRARGPSHLRKPAERAWESRTKT